MLKISEQYLDFYKSYCQLIKNLPYWVAYLSQETVNLVKGRPLSTKKICLISNNFYINQDIALKFSACVYHMSVLNWQKNFWHYSIYRSAAPPSVPKLPTPLATIFVEIFSKKIFGEVLEQYQPPHWRNFEYLEKNGVLKFLERVFRPGNFSGSWAVWHDTKVFFRMLM